MGSGFVESQPLQVLLGKGDGTFQPASRFWSATSIPDKIVVADFNKDGRPDLALTINPNGIAILLGKGDGSFSPPVMLPTDTLPNGLTAADVDGDGIVDLIATELKIDVFLGKGDGTFQPKVQYAIDEFPNQVATGDFNGDGKVDIAATGSAAITGYLGILFGNGDGTFQAALTYGANTFAPANLAVADLNGDGVDDVLVTADYDSIFLSGPIATITPSYLNFGTIPVGVDAGPHSITVTNSGNGPLIVAGGTTAAPFAINGTICESSLNRLANCTIPVTVNPSAAGKLNGQIFIQENANHLSGKPVVLLTGTAVTPTLNVTPSSLNFNNETINVASASQTVTLTNTSSLPLTIASINTSGPYSATSQCGASLAPAKTCTVAVTFTPTATGQQTGSLSISDNASGSPQTVALTGAGVADLSISAQTGGSTSATVKAGSTATYALQLSVAPGFTGTASLACTGAPTHAACSITPASVTLASGGTTNFTVTVTTSQQTTASYQPLRTIPFAGAGVLVGVLVLPFARKRSRFRAGFFMLFILTAAASILGCGGSSAPKTPPVSTTAPGTYQLTVAANSGAASATQALTLIVQ